MKTFIRKGKKDEGIEKKGKKDEEIEKREGRKMKKL